jgi:hypothetical protein
MTEEAPKIIIDEDWKAKVEREKREAAEAAPADIEAQDDAESATPSFDRLVSSLAMQVMIALGAVGPRDAKEVVVDLEEARYLIDILMILREKTKGNLTPKEEGHLTGTLADLQNGFVVRSQQMQEANLRNMGAGPMITP